MFTPFETAAGSSPVIRAGGAVQRALPANLHPADRALFDDDLTATIPDTRLVELGGVAMNEYGLLFTRARILPESFSSPAVRARFFGRRRNLVRFLAANYLVRRRRRIRGPALAITDDWSAGYFHWLADALPRLVAVGDRARSLILLLPHTFERLEFVQASLKLFALGGIEYVRAGEIVVCDRLVLPTHTAPSGHYNEALMHDLRGVILDAHGIGVERTPGERLYISRARAPRRRIRNEAEATAVLNDFGFRTVCFEDLPFDAQVRLAARASHVVSNHGAGLANILFMPPGGSVLELRRAGDRERNWFFNLASAARLAYYYQNCDGERADDDPHTGDLLVDTRALRETLAAFTARRVNTQG